MAQKVKIDNLAREITKAMQEYTEDVEDGVAKVVDQTAEECEAEIAANSPVRKGKYKSGWSIVKDNARHSYSRVIWNPKYYRLVHLLEKGHAKRGGGRVAGKPHVGPAEQKYSAKLLDRIEQVVRKGGK